MADTESYFYTLKVDLFTTSVKGDKKLQNGNKRLKVQVWKWGTETPILGHNPILPFFILDPKWTNAKFHCEWFNSMAATI